MVTAESGHILQKRKVVKFLPKNFIIYFFYKIKGYIIDDNIILRHEFIEILLWLADHKYIHNKN